MVDGILLLDDRLVTILRGKPPFPGMHALPGGIVELGETAETAVRREFEEETGLQVETVGIVGLYSNPGRDPRGHAVSVAFALLRVGGRLRAGTDAAAVELVNPRHLPPMAFDHAEIVRDYLAGGQRFP